VGGEELGRIVLESDNRDRLFAIYLTWRSALKLIRVPSEVIRISREFLASM
jgi:hypothetical protein